MATTPTPTRRNPIEDLRCRVPEMSHDGLVVSRFTIEKNDLEVLRLAMDGRGTRPGTYTMLEVDGRLWMSDTDAERYDHAPAVWAADKHLGGRGLVNGLGLGCVLGAWLDRLDHVDVVESDARVVEHVGGWFRQEYGDRVTIHHADAYDIEWPKDVAWDVAWHDIWPTLCFDDLADHARLNRKYGRRVQWQGAWGHDLLLRERRRHKNAPWAF